MKNKFIIMIIIGLLSAQVMSIPLHHNPLASKTATEESKILIQIDTTKGLPLIPSTMEIVSGYPGSYIELITTEKELDYFSDQHVSYTIKDTNLDEAALSTIDSYPTLDEFEEQLETIASDYPEITSLFSIGKSYEDRDLWCLEITDNPGQDEQEPEVLFMGVHHAREWPTLAVTLTLIKELVESYEENETIKELVNNRRIWVIPCVNPDGYHYDHDEFNGNKWWRKNRHYFPDFRLYGVDLNRNYGGSSNGLPESMWGSFGISHHPKSSVFCGTEPFSELEIQHIKQFFLNHSIDASISWHTYGELVMWPWGYTTEDQAPDEEYMSAIGNDIAQEITQIDGSGCYTPTQSSGLYPTTGDTTDWFYGYSHYVLGRPHFAYTIESGDSFHPDESYLKQVCDENVDGALVLLKEAENITQVPSRVIPPKVIQTRICENNSLSVVWEERNPQAGLQKVLVEQLSDCSIAVDQVTEENNHWDLSGFSISSSRSQSGDFSYQSHRKDGEVSAMTTRYPIFVTPEMKLSFWCSYDIEENYDYAFVEISTNQRTYTVLDSFTGDRSEWEYNEYDLSEYEGQSVFIRFRYFTDENTNEDGFWVDDIYPVSTFTLVSTVYENIVSSPFYLSIPENTTSYFRLKGYNEVYRWGDYGQLYPLSEFMGNIAPLIPTISGKTRGKTGNSQTYNIRSIDPNQDDVFYQVNWGDGNQTGWIGPYSSDESIEFEHSWNTDGTYTITARAKDTNDAISEWGDLEVQMPHTFNHPLIHRIQIFINWLYSLSK
ncbi:MAG: immune inhibitor A [Candidatus Thermoplasmatota archaeon]|nr:immune inhibitor A [Candidatus Thermoplasmatota archaeon]